MKKDKLSGLTQKKKQSKKNAQDYIVISAYCSKERTILMPIKIPGDLPARHALESENIFVMTEEKASSQDIRPLEIAIVNLMPTKIATETQLLRVLGNTPLQVNITLVRMANHEARNTPSDHLERFYQTFEQLRHRPLDGLIVTGAPVEHLDFKEVNYWNEIVDIMNYAHETVYSTLYICWAAQAALFHNYGIPKYALPEKISGVFPHRLLRQNCPLFRGFDDTLHMPHSRHTEIRRVDVDAVGQVDILLESAEAGPAILMAEEGRHIYVTGHLEYDADTLDGEYQRDLGKGLNPKVPANYYPDNNPACPPLVNWRAHAHLFFSNWLNYYVYQGTPYDIQTLAKGDA